MKGVKINLGKQIYSSSDNNAWKNLAKVILEEKEIALIFEGNNKELRTLGKKMKNQFWKEVLNTWYDYGDNIECISENKKISNTVIWSSGLMRNYNLTNRRNYFISKGIIYLKDLYNYEKKSFKTRQEMLDRHNITITFLTISVCNNQYKEIIRLYDPKTDEN